MVLGVERGGPPGTGGVRSRWESTVPDRNRRLQAVLGRFCPEPTGTDRSRPERFRRGTAQGRPQEPPGAPRTSPDRILEISSLSLPVPDHPGGEGLPKPGPRTLSPYPFQAPAACGAGAASHTNHVYPHNHGEKNMGNIGKNSRKYGFLIFLIFPD